MKLSLQYVAGLFDGEGSIGIYRCHGGRFTLRTQLVQNIYPQSKVLFKQLTARYGGNSSPQYKDRSFNWQLNAQKARVFLEDIQPYLRLKREEAEIAIKWQLSKPLPSRNKTTGWFNPYTHDKQDAIAARLLKQLKRRKK